MKSLASIGLLTVASVACWGNDATRPVADAAGLFTVSQAAAGRTSYEQECMYPEPGTHEGATAELVGQFYVGSIALCAAAVRKDVEAYSVKVKCVASVTCMQYTLWHNMPAGA